MAVTLGGHGLDGAIPLGGLGGADPRLEEGENFGEAAAVAILLRALISGDGLSCDCGSSLR